MDNLLVYILDTNVFIQAYRTSYPFDVVPGFWECLVEHAGTDRVQSIDSVYQELLVGHDELAQWAKGQKALLFKPTLGSDFHNQIVQAYQDIYDIVKKTSRYQDLHRTSFMGGADVWVIAYAKAVGGIVVTMEVPAPTSTKVKIPDICQQIGVPWINTLGMLRGMGIRLGFI